MIACHYQDLFPYTNDVIHQKSNIDWNENNEKLKAIKPDTRPWKETEETKSQVRSQRSIKTARRKDNMSLSGSFFIF